MPHQHLRHIRSRIAFDSFACRLSSSIPPHLSDPLAVLHPALTGRGSASSILESSPTQHPNEHHKGDDLEHGVNRALSRLCNSINGGFPRDSTSDFFQSRWEHAAPHNRQADSRSYHNASSISMGHAPQVDYGQPSHETHPEVRHSTLDLAHGKLLPEMRCGPFAMIHQMDTFQRLTP